MGFGLEVRNDASYLQIDQDYRNQVLLNRVTVNTTTAAAAGVAGRDTWLATWYRYRAQSPESLIALRCTSTLCLIFGVTLENGTYVWTICCYAGPASVPVEIFEFGPAPVSANSGYGLNVFDAQGRLAFSSNFQYMKVVDYINVANFTDPLNGQDQLTGATVTYTAGRSYAVCSGWGAGIYDAYQVWTNEWEVSLLMMGFTSVDAGFRVKGEYFYSQSASNGGGTGATDYKYQLVIIDVTDL
ncbi:hypothetical protein [Pseudomonas massiliensis]|uniref:hypothetical protein n=1 Tax=Pseudomonas massiliensis TaxID=522492 RepID=UPI00058BE711|nr:hypothetical protein [Pseudomonas massiliensis]